MRVKKGMFEEDNLFCELGYCCVYIKNFLRQYCQGDIEKLSEFNFLTVIDDKEYGNVGKSGGRKKGATPQNTKIAKAIFYLLMGNKPVSTFDSFFEKDSNCQGFLINQFSTLFSEDYSLKTLKKILNNPKYDNFLEKVEKFYEKTNTLGNFIFLPNLQNIEWTQENNNSNFAQKINYYDIFLSEINKVFTNTKDKSNALEKYINENSNFFNSDAINEDIQSFCDFNFLTNFIDRDNEIIIDFNPHYTFMELINNIHDDEFKTKYVNFANEYMDKASKLIEKRASQIIKALCKRIV